MTLIRCSRACQLFCANVLAFLALLPSSALAAPISFVNIADTRLGQFLSISDSPTISSNGIVAFEAALVSGGEGVFTGSGGPVTTIADSTGVFRTFSAHPSVNAGGTVAFRAQLDTLNTGIFTGNGGLVTPIATDVFPGSNLVGFSEPTINDQGKIVFSATLLGTIGNRILLSQGGILTPLYDTTGPFSSFIGTPFINSAGNVVFVAGLDTGGTGIFVGNGGPTITIATSSGPFSTFGPDPTLSDTGVVAFLARLDTGAQGIFIGDGTQTTKFVDSTDPLFLGGFLDPSINAQGTVAYSAQTACSGGEVLAGPDPIADRVVGTTGTLCAATALFGDFVTRTSFLHGLNNLNQLTGTADLARGGEVVFLANLAGPAAGDGSGTTLPEPGTLLLFAFGFTAFLYATRARRNRSIYGSR
jgi:hypothetical protein